MDASEDSAANTAEEPEVQDVAAPQGEELELALANMTVEGAFIAYSNVLRTPLKRLTADGGASLTSNF